MNTQLYKLLLENGLDANHYVLMTFLQNGDPLGELEKNPRVLAWLLTLERKELVIKANGYDITEAGRRLLTVINSGGVAVEERVEKSPQVTIASVHASLQDALVAVKNKKQVVGFGGVYFIPSLRDLEEFLNRFRRKYPELWDLAKIQKCLVTHVTKCAKLDKYAPAVKYYIIKEGTGSQLAAALEAYEDVAEEKEKQFKVKETKSYFE